jgi:hypothetical protein
VPSQPCFSGANLASDAAKEGETYVLLELECGGNEPNLVAPLSKRWDSLKMSSIGFIGLRAVIYTAACKRAFRRQQRTFMDELLHEQCVVGFGNALESLRLYASQVMAQIYSKNRPPEAQ